MTGSHGLIVGTTEVLASTICTWDNGGSAPVVWKYLDVITQLVLGACMCLLIVIRFIRELVQMYKVTKGFRLNNYMRLLVWEGLIYFVVYVRLAVVFPASLNISSTLVHVITYLLSYGTSYIPVQWLILLAVIQQPLPFMLIPRFILNLREMYADDLQGRRGSNIDTASSMGLRSGPGPFSAIVFADAVQNEGELGGEPEMEETVQEMRRTSNCV